MKKAFTLIELLIVVLIIGILAAVALPQYQKAVNKSRLNEWLVSIKGYYAGIESYLLANGFPASRVRFTGDGTEANSSFSSLDIEMPCIKEEGTYCYTKIGRFNVACASNGCWVDLGTNYTDYSGWLPKGHTLYTSRYSASSQIILTHVPTDSSWRKLVCQFWKERFGVGAMNDEVKTTCAAVGLE